MNEQTKLELLKIAAQYACTSIQMSGEIPANREEYTNLTKKFFAILHRDYHDLINTQERGDSAQ